MDRHRRFKTDVETHDSPSNRVNFTDLVWKEKKYSRDDEGENQGWSENEYKAEQGLVVERNSFTIRAKKTDHVEPSHKRTLFQFHIESNNGHRLIELSLMLMEKKLPHSDDPIEAYTSIKRMDKQLLPKDFAMECYDALLDFIDAQVLQKPIEHQVSAEPQDMGMSKWRSKFEPVLNRREYTQTSANKWEKTYQPVKAESA